MPPGMSNSWTRFLKRTRDRANSQGQWGSTGLSRARRVLGPDKSSGREAPSFPQMSVPLAQLLLRLPGRLRQSFDSSLGLSA